MKPRPMAVWLDRAGRVVGQISQGVQRGAAVYIAEAVGLAPDPCPRFACAKRKVEGALLVAGIEARVVV